MTKAPYMSVDTDRGIQSSLSTKISVIVFWLMIVAGMGFSFYLLHDREEKIMADYVARANGLAYDLDNLMQEKNVAVPARIEEEFRRLMRQYRAEAIELGLGKKSYQQGLQRPDQVVYSRTFDYHPVARETPHGNGIAKISFAPFHEAVSRERKQVLIYMGIVLLSFGLLLHWVLRRILTQPFQGMVQTAKSITHGETMLRFDEKRLDEFGFLARFINKALDFVTLKQKH